MTWLRKIKFLIYRLRNAWRKRRRLFFPSPAEIELIRIMGGKYITISWFKDIKTGFPLTIVTDLGTILKRELIEREVRVGAMYIDLAVETPYYKKGLEIDGLAFHQDITKEQERDEYLGKYGWRVLHIQAASIYREPNIVSRRIIEFLAK